jgi:hypothetical protein
MHRLLTCALGSTMQGLQMRMLLESATETVGQVRQKISPSHYPSFLARHMCCDLQTPTVLRHTDRPQLKLVLHGQHIASQREVITVRLLFLHYDDDYKKSHYCYTS